MKTGNTRQDINVGRAAERASMEPGHEDREYICGWHIVSQIIVGPQWSPAMKTGNTCRSPARRPRSGNASMEPGHEDREYWVISEGRHSTSTGLNGARP